MFLEYEMSLGRLWKSCIMEPCNFIENELHLLFSRILTMQIYLATLWNTFDGLPSIQARINKSLIKHFHQESQRNL